MASIEVEGKKKNSTSSYDSLMAELDAAITNGSISSTDTTTPQQKDILDEMDEVISSNDTTGTVKPQKIDLSVKGGKSLDAAPTTTAKLKPQSGGKQLAVAPESKDVTVVRPDKLALSKENAVRQSRGEKPITSQQFTQQTQQKQNEFKAKNRIPQQKLEAVENPLALGQRSTMRDTFNDITGAYGELGRAVGQASGGTVNLPFSGNKETVPQLTRTLTQDSFGARELPETLEGAAAAATGEYLPDFFSLAIPGLQAGAGARLGARLIKGAATQAIRGTAAQGYKEVVSGRAEENPLNAATNTLVMGTLPGAVGGAAGELIGPFRGAVTSGTEALELGARVGGRAVAEGAGNFLPEFGLRVARGESAQEAAQNALPSAAIGAVGSLGGARAPGAPDAPQMRPDTFIDPLDNSRLPSTIVDPKDGSVIDVRQALNQPPSPGWGQSPIMGGRQQKMLPGTAPLPVENFRQGAPTTPLDGPQPSLNPAVQTERQLGARPTRNMQSELDAFRQEVRPDSATYNTTQQLTSPRAPASFNTTEIPQAPQPRSASPYATTEMELPPTRDMSNLGARPPVDRTPGRQTTELVDYASAAKNTSPFPQAKYKPERADAELRTGQLADKGTSQFADKPQITDPMEAGNVRAQYNEAQPLPKYLEDYAVKQLGARKPLVPGEAPKAAAEKPASAGAATDATPIQPVNKPVEKGTQSQPINSPAQQPPDAGTKSQSLVKDDVVTTGKKANDALPVAAVKDPFKAYRGKGETARMPQVDRAGILTPIETFEARVKQKNPKLMDDMRAAGITSQDVNDLLRVRNKLNNPEEWKGISVAKKARMVEALRDMPPEARKVMEDFIKYSESSTSEVVKFREETPGDLVEALEQDRLKQYREGRPAGAAGEIKKASNEPQGVAAKKALLEDAMNYRSPDEYVKAVRKGALSYGENVELNKRFREAGIPTTDDRVLNQIHRQAQALKRIRNEASKLAQELDDAGMAKLKTEPEQVRWFSRREQALFKRYQKAQEKLRAAEEGNISDPEGGFIDLGAFFGRPKKGPASASQGALNVPNAPQKAKTPFLKAVSSYTKASLLSTISGRLGDLTGTGIYQIAKDLVQKPVAALADIALSKKTGKRTTGANTSLKAAGKAVTEGAPEAFNMILKRKLDPDLLKKLEVEEVFTGDNPISKVFDNFINGVFRTAGAVDLPSKNYALQSAIDARLNVEAANNKNFNKAQFADLLEKGKAGKPLSQLEAEIYNAAQLEAADATFNKDNAISTFINGVKENLWAGKDLDLGVGGKWKIDTAAKKKAAQFGAFFVDQLLPFVRVTSNVAIKGADLTAGAGYRGGKAALQARKTGLTPELQAIIAKSIGEGALGTAALFAGIALYKYGYGSPKSDDKEDRGRNMAANRPKGSIEFMGQNIPTRIFGPLGNLANFGMALMEAKNESEDVTQMVSDIASRTLEIAIDHPLTESLKQSYKAIAEKGGIKREGARRIANLVPLGVTELSGAAAAVQGKKSYEKITENAGKDFITGTKEAIQERIPIVRESLPNKVSPLGNVIEKPATAPINPFRTKDLKNEQIVKEADRIGASISGLTREKEETTADFSKRSQVYGKILEKNLTSLISSKAYEQAAKIAKKGIPLLKGVSEEAIQREMWDKMMEKSRGQDLVEVQGIDPWDIFDEVLNDYTNKPVKAIDEKIRKKEIEIEGKRMGVK